MGSIGFRKIGLVQSVVPLLIAIAGCSNGPPTASSPLAEGATFVSVQRTLASAAAAQRRSLRIEAVPGSDATESFYLAINKKDLGKRFFLSAYMKQNFPGRPASIAALSLGIKVVTFRVQNGKLFVFDAGDGKANSDTFDPTLVVEAYPIVDNDTPFQETAGSDQYVLFDPAAGLNRFGVVSDFFGNAFLPLHFQVDLSFLQAFRRIGDGVTFEQVFTGNIAEPAPDDLTEPGNPFAVSGTLAIALRDYREGQGFQPLVTDIVDSRGKSTADSPNLPKFFFENSPLTNKNEGTQRLLASKFNIHKGMKPIEWRYSPGFLDVQKELPQYDFIGAIRAGVEGWNDVFGFPAFKAVQAGPNDSFADDDKNFIIFDADPTLTFAFADSRHNPNSGETRGATVYFGSHYFRLADEEFDADAGAKKTATGSKAARRQGARKPLRQLVWGDMKPQILCALDGESLIARELADGGSDAKALSKKEKVEKFITHLVAHEVGHTLGLRHNFKGSLQPNRQQSSVMEYILDLDIPAAGRDKPGPYDVDAIKLLYGLSKKLPTNFCTDEDLEVDPDCNQFDRGNDPLNQFYGRFYPLEVSDFLHGGEEAGDLDAINDDLNQLADWVRGGTPAQQLQAFAYIDVAPVGVDFSKDEAMSPGFQARADGLLAGNLRRLFLDPAGLRGELKADPQLAGDLQTALLHELDGVLRNVDKYRSYEARRTVVDVLKKLQQNEALTVLSAARPVLAAERASLPPGSADAPLLDDLIVRLDAALHPYFAQ